MVEVDIDSTFYLKVKGYENDSPEYKEYRRRWNEDPREFIVGDYPIHVDLETNTNCNLRCFMCFQAFDTPPTIKMDLDLFKKIIDEGADRGLCSIKTQVRGEPLLDKRMPEMVKYAKDKGIIEVMFNTNANLMNEEVSKKLIESRMDKIICSVDGYEKEVYENIRIGGKFEVVLENIKRFQKIKKELGLHKPILRVQMVDTPRNHHQIEDYIKFWSEIVENVAVEEMLDLSGEEEDDTVLDGWACGQLWQRLIVLADGDVLPCCRALSGGDNKLSVVGNAYNNSIEEIWKSEKMEKLRELHKAGRSHEIRMCRFCGLRKNMVAIKKNSGTAAEHSDIPC